MDPDDRVHSIQTPTSASSGEQSSQRHAANWSNGSTTMSSSSGDSESLPSTAPHTRSGHDSSSAGVRRPCMPLGAALAVSACACGAAASVTLCLAPFACRGHLLGDS